MNRTAFFLGLSGLAVTLGAIATAATGPGPVAAALGGAAAAGAFDFARDLLKDRLKGWVNSPPEAPGKLFANGHLTQLIGEAIQVVLARELKQEDLVGTYREQLRALLPHVVAYWQAYYPRLTDGSLEEAHAANLTAVLHGQIQGTEDFELATVEAWEDFLRDYAREQKVDLEDEPRRRAAERLHRELGHALYEKAKQAAETNPRAAAAIQLQFQSWLLQGIAELHESVRAGFADQTRALARLHVQLLALAADVPEIKQIVRDSLAAVQRLERAFGGLSQQVADLQPTVDRIEGVVTQTHADVREMKGPVIETQAVVQRLKSGMQTLVSRPQPAGATPLPDLTGYRQHIVGRFAEHRLSGLESRAGDTTGSGQPRLAEIFVPLDTKADPPKEPNGQHARRIAESDRLAIKLESPGEEVPKPVPAIQRLAQHPRLVLLGLAGSGKSTLLRFVSLTLAQQGLKPDAAWFEKEMPGWPAGERDLVPVFLELRKFAAGLPSPLPRVTGCAPLWDFLVAQLTPHKLADSKPALEAALEAGRALVFFDGLDEVPGDAGKQHVAQLIQEFGRGRFAQSRVVVTCRNRAYEEACSQLPGFVTAELLDLDDEKIATFIQRFYAELREIGRCHAVVAADRTASLQQAVRHRRDLRKLACRPMLLTVMAMVHLDEHLPEKRSALFEKFTDLLLFRWEENKRRDDDPATGDGPGDASVAELLRAGGADDKTIFRGVLNRLAYEARRGQGAADENVRILISQGDLRQALEKLTDKTLATESRRAWAVQMLNALEFRAGLLIPEPGDRYSLPHKLQEFMAAGHLTNPQEFEDFEQEAAALVDGRPDWEEVVTLAAGIQAHVAKRPSDAAKLAYTLCVGEAEPAVALRRAFVATEILRDLRLSNVGNLKKGPDWLKAVRERLASLTSRSDLGLKARALAAACRGWLEDLPDGVGCRPAANGTPALPHVEVVDVAGVDFIMGSPHGEGYRDEHPQLKPCKLLPHGFKLSRYPVTVAQFEAFIEAGGYGTGSAEAPRPEWWTQAGWAWRLKEKRERPDDYDAIFQTPNHPRVGVSWYEAHAFARWLHQHRVALGVPADWHIRLPWEAEWERTARGTDGRIYPWGSEPPEGRCNFASQIGHTSAVGLFPAGDAVEGAGRIADLAGNVWEWCATRWRKNYEDYEQRVDNSAAGEDDRVVRGGAWFNDAVLVRGACRSRFRPDDRLDDLGFRLAASPISGL
jgi:formylglycine-generating enzyme required for sulfatase activity